MNTQLPPERTLTDKQSRVATILRDETPSPRRWLIPIAAAASMALVGGALYAVSTAGSGGQADGTGQPATTRAVPKAPKSSEPDTVDILDHELTGSELTTFTANCLDAATQPAWPGHGKGIIFEPEEIAYAWSLMDSSVPSSPVWFLMVVEDQQSSSTFSCIGTSKDGQIPAVEGLNSGAFRGPLAVKSSTKHTDPTHPAVPAGGGGMDAGAMLDDDQPDPLSTYPSLYVVDERVAAMRQRVYVKGEQPGPWRTSAAHGGYAAVLTLTAGHPLHVGDKIVVETQVLDEQGNLLDAPADQLGGGGLAPSPGTTRVDTYVMEPGPLNTLIGELLE